MDKGDEPHAVRMARLRVSAPEVVFENLKAAAEAERSRLSTVLDEELEAALARRNEPLIDLGLARYATASKVVTPLLAAGLAKPSSEEDSIHRRGLRVSCYANRQLGSFLSEGLLSELASPQQAVRIVEKGDLSELAVLLRNPAVGDKTLADLFRGTGPFAGLPEDRWCKLVQLAADNPRIVAPGDEEHGPDWGFWEIHKGLFQLVRTAPATERWCFALHYMLAHARPPSVVIDEPIDATLKRWSHLEIKDRNGEPTEGFYSELPMSEEFLCLIASAYGTRFVDSQYEFAGTPRSPTVAERCAYYAGAKLTKKDAAAFLARDSAAFSLAFMFNDSAILNAETRAFFEERGNYDRQLYKFRVGVLAREWPFLQRLIPSWEMEEDAQSNPLMFTLVRLEGEIAELKKQFRVAAYSLILGFSILAYLARR